MQESSLKYEPAERGDTLGEQVYRQLASAVLSGAFAPLERLNVRRLAEGMNVSITPAREAVLRLIAEEVLEMSPRGTVIVPERGEAEVAEIFDIRRMLEGRMAEVAAPLLTDDDLEFLERTQESFLEALAAADFKQVLRWNSAFHFHIYRCAGLPVSLRIAESLWLRIGPTLRHMYPYLHKNRADHRRHENIIEAARRRDPAGLRDAILADLASSEEALNRYARDAAAAGALRPVPAQRQ